MDRRILLLLAAIIVVLLLLVLDIPQLIQRPLVEKAVPVSSDPIIVEAPDAPLPEPTPEEEIPFITESVKESIVAPLASSTYLIVEDSCGPYFNGECLNIRSGPSASTTRVLFAREGMVLPIDETLEHDGRTWYRVVFSEWLRFPERVSGPWYVARGFGSVVTAPASESFDASTTPKTTKRIIVDRSDQLLIAYDGEEVFMQEKISTGLDLTPTPRGTFTVFRKTPSRYMQGPLAGISNDYYDLPGVPWNLYFTHEGGAIHGTYWHDHFGQQWSHGCVNLPEAKARMLYEWAPLGTTVTVRD